MRPDHLNPDNRSADAYDGNRSPGADGVQGLVPGALQAARRLYHAGKIDAALEQLDPLFTAPTDGADHGPPLSLRDATLLRAWCLIEQKRHAMCRQWLDRARQSGYLDGDDLGAMVIELNIRLFGEDYEGVADDATELLEQAKDGRRLEYAELRLLLGASLRWQGKLNQALDHVEYAVSAFTVLEEPARCAVATNFLGWTYVSLGRLAEGRRWFEKSLELNTRLGAKIRMAQNYQNLSIACYKQGHYETACELLERELELTGDHPDMTCRARIALGNVLRLRGDLLNARASLLTAYSLATENDLAREEVLALEFLGDVFRDETNPAEARRYYQRGLAAARALAPRGDLVMELLRRDGECLELEGRTEEAHHVLNEALELCEEVGDRFETAVTRRCLGVNAARLGRWKYAVEQLQTSVAELDQLEARHEKMLATWHLSRTLIRQIDTGNAGARTGRLLGEAWRVALMAQQLNQDLNLDYLAEEIDDLVADLARRRLQDKAVFPQPAAFSARRAPATRVVAVSSAMQQVLRKLDGFARYENPVLIAGESGSGKELLARRLHENSPRGSQPLVRIGCAATAIDVLAAELFGRIGSDADNGSPGLVAQTAGGTLLLDGIDNLPQPLQGKLLRLIQDGIYRCQGDSKERQANVRIIATTDTELAVLVDQNRFRPDLFFRLRLMSVTVPPLRERPEDVMPLLDHFLSKLEGSTLAGRTLFDAQALSALTEHHWPGGAAELEAIAQQAWLNRDLGRPVVLRRVEGQTGSTLEFLEQKRTAAGATVEHPSGMTWTSLRTMLNQAGGNKSRVAKNLGISRMTLYRWLKQLEPGAQ